MLRELILAIGLLTLLGCSDDASTVGNRPGAQVEPKESTPTLTLATPAEFAQELAARRGKVVLVEMWATW